MGMGFHEEFLKYCQGIRPKLIRIILTYVIGTGLLAYNEYSYYSGSTNELQILGCGRYDNQNSWASDYSTISIDTCFHANMTDCINVNYGQYSTPGSSNSTLEFNVPFLGVPEDKLSRFLGVLVFLTFLIFIVSYQLLSHFAMTKRVRIQQLLAKSKVYILCNRSTGYKKSLYILIITSLYVIIKVGFILNRQNYYSRIECDGTKYHLSFTLEPSSWIPGIAQNVLIYLLMSIGYLTTVVNFLSDMDLRNLLIHLSPSSINQISDITVLPVDSFKRLISNQVDINYLHLSFIPKLIKKSVFLLPWFSINDNEIVKYILHYKSVNPNAFYPHNILLSEIVGNGLKDTNETI